MEKSIKKIVALGSIFIVFLVITNVSQKITMNLFQEKYSVFAAQFMNIFCVPFNFLLLLIKYGKITDGSRNFPKLVYFYLAILDSFGVTLVAIGNQKTPGEIQILLSQLSIPFSMIGSIIWLKKRYGWKSYLGFLVIMIGIFVAVYTLNHSDKYNIVDILIFASASVFFALSFVGKEWCFHDNKQIGPMIKRLVRVDELPIADPYHLLAWVSLFMVPVSFIVYLIQCIPFLGNIKMDDLWQNMVDGAKCMININSSVTDTCHGTWLPLWSWLIVYSFTTFISAVLAIVLTRDGSAVIKFLAHTLVIPLNAFAFSFAPIMYPFTEEVSLWNIASIIIIVGGLILYAYGDPNMRKPKFDSTYDIFF